MHISDLHKFTSDSSREFSLTYVKGNGELITIDRCVCTSFHSAGTTMNVKLLPSGEIRKLRRLAITSINNNPFYL